MDLTTESDGLPVFGWDQGHRVHLRRLLPDGRPDPRFGGSGTVTLGCRCHLESVEATRGGGLLVCASVRRQLFAGEEAEPVGFVVERLLANGARDRSFAGDGVARVRARTWYGAVATEGGDGSVLLTGSIKRAGGGPSFFVARVTRGGDLDRGFGKAAVAAASGAYAHDSYQWESLYAFPHGHDLELVAPTSGKTAIFRLGPDGHLDRSFGEDGETLLRLGFAAAAPAGGGRLFVVGYRGEPWTVHMLNADGSVDRAFGSLFLPGAFSEYGMSIYPDGPGRAIVVSPGESICEGCKSEPRIYRVLD